MTKYAYSLSRQEVVKTIDSIILFVFTWRKHLQIDTTQHIRKKGQQIQKTTAHSLDMLAATVYDVRIICSCLCFGLTLCFGQSDFNYCYLLFLWWPGNSLITSPVTNCSNTKRVQPVVSTVVSSVNTSLVVFCICSMFLWCIWLSVCSAFVCLCSVVFAFSMFVYLVLLCLFVCVFVLLLCIWLCF